MFSLHDANKKDCISRLIEYLDRVRTVARLCPLRAELSTPVWQQVVKLCFLHILVALWILSDHGQALYAIVEEIGTEQRQTYCLQNLSNISKIYKAIVKGQGGGSSRVQLFAC